MDNWMAPRAFAAGGNGKLARQGRSAGQAARAGGSDEEGGGGATMGLLKRKRTSPPESPAPSKKRTAEEADLPRSSSSEPLEGTPGNSLGGKTSTLSGETRVSKQLLGHDNEFMTAVEVAEDTSRSTFVEDVDDLQNRMLASVENVSHGQGASFQAPLHPETSGPAVAFTLECEPRLSTIPHRIPSHAGWFQWARIHQLERLALPEFFSRNNSQKTPELYVEHRNCIITKYRENPQKLLKFEDVQELLTGDVSDTVRVFSFLDHWGLINYQVITDFSSFSSSRGPLGSVEETNGALQFSPLVNPPLANLFNFEAALTPAPAPLSTRPASNLPPSSLAEAAVQESLAAPAVEYHCNSCQADCSKRRYHCQKQADFDLCPNCYGDGKFGQGMTGMDFLRMDALTDTADANGCGWSDQETLLLLEALELYGDNWSEIAEHVATKSKAQCILHFIRLPIEDPFLEDMEATNSVIISQPPSTVVSRVKGVVPSNDKDAQAKSPQNGNSSSTDKVTIEGWPSNPEQNDSVPIQKEKEDKPYVAPTQESNGPAATAGKMDEPDPTKKSSKVEGSSDAHMLLVAADSAGCVGPGGLLAFADAGNPVMTQVAFLAAMVGPRVAAAAAQAALKSLAEEDPVGFLSARNSFALEFPDKKDGIFVSGPSDRLHGHRSPGNQSLTSAGGPTESSDGKAALTMTEEGIKNGAPGKVTETETLDKTAGEGEAQRSQKPDVNIPTKTVVAEQDAPSVAKMQSAAASALASAAVKAKLLADQEEREIQRLVAGVIENQLKKLELKLKHFADLESLLGKECEQAEKARTKVYTERAHIMASRLGSSSSANQIQSAVSISATHVNSSSLSCSPVTQPKPVVFTFGPTGVSAPAAVYKAPSGPESSTSSMPAGASSQQGLASQRLPRHMPVTSVASGVN